MTDSPMGALVRKFRPELMDNPMVVSVVDEYGANLSPEESSKLEKVLPGMICAIECQDYPSFRAQMESCGWGGMAPMLYAMIQDMNSDE